MPCEVFLMAHLISARRISLLGSIKGIVGGIGDAIFTIVVVSVPLSRAKSFTWALMLNWDSTYWTSRWYLMARRLALNSLVRIRLLLLSPSFGDLVLLPLLDEVPVRSLWSSGFWRTHWYFPAWCSLHHQYYFPYLVLLPTPTFSSSIIQGGGSLM